jgi:hypothetical protein
VARLNHLPIEAEADDGEAGGIGKMFSDPNMWGKLAANPKTAPLLNDPQFVAQVGFMLLPSFLFPLSNRFYSSG